MIEPVDNGLVRQWFKWYCRYALRKHFHRVHLYGNIGFDAGVSTLYLPNHSSFWDPIALNYLIQYWRPQKAFCMSDIVQMRKHPFFRRVGAFSVDRTSPRESLASIQYAARLLNTAPCAVVVYPQGKVEANDRRPIKFQRGVERIIQLAPAANVVMVTMRYGFWLNQRPELQIDLCEVRVRALSDMEILMTQRLDLLREAENTYRAGEQILLKGRRSIADS